MFVNGEFKPTKTVSWIYVYITTRKAKQQSIKYTNKPICWIDLKKKAEEVNLKRTIGFDYVIVSLFCYLKSRLQTNKQWNKKNHWNKIKTERVYNEMQCKHISNATTNEPF